MQLTNEKIMDTGTESMVCDSIFAALLFVKKPLNGFLY